MTRLFFLQLDSVIQKHSFQELGKFKLLEVGFGWFQDSTNKIPQVKKNEVFMGLGIILF